MVITDDKINIQMHGVILWFIEVLQNRNGVSGNIFLVIDLVFARLLSCLSGRIITAQPGLCLSNAEQKKKLDDDSD